jgi:predicted RNase H-like HicB family nuclease
MKQTFSCGLAVTIFREGKTFIAYSPALDLSSCGSSEQEAKRMFTEAVEVFFEELIAIKTVDATLKDLGWTKKKGQFQPPEIVKQAVVNVMVPCAA